MPRVTIDTSEAKSFEPVEPGPYPMTVGTIEFKTSKDSKQPMMEVYFEFEDPKLAQKAGSVIRNYMLAGKGAGFTREFLKNVSGGSIDIPVGGTFDFDSDDLIGRHVVVEVSNETYDGVPRNKADRVIAA